MINKGAWVECTNEAYGTITTGVLLEDVRVPGYTQATISTETGRTRCEGVFRRVAVPEYWTGKKP